MSSDTVCGNQALLLLGFPGDDPRMAKARLRHLKDSVITPGWRVTTFLLLDFLGGLLTLRDEIAPGFLDEEWGGISMIQFTWEGWVIATLAGLLILLFEGSFRVRRRLEAERDQAVLNLQAVGREVPLVFDGCQLLLSPTSGPKKASDFVTGFKILLRNAGANRIKYRVVRLDLEVDGVKATFGQPVNTGTIIPPSMTYAYDTGKALNPFKIADIKSGAQVEFEVEYDTVPPTNRRTFGKRLLLASDYKIPGTLDYKFLNEWET